LSATSLTSACKEYQLLIEKERFYEAHEVLEAFWFERRKEKTPFALSLKAFINAAVSFELWRRGKRDGALRVWKTYLKYRHFVQMCHEPVLDETKAFVERFSECYLSRGDETQL
jgi:hypothetical protein